MPKKKKPVYRLKDMLVEEVSLVDRAANRRRFLVTKNADESEIGEEIADETPGTSAEEQVEKKTEVSQEAAAFVNSATTIAAKLVEMADSVRKGAKMDKALGEALAEEGAGLLKLGATFAPDLLKSEDEKTKVEALQEELASALKKAEEAEARTLTVKAEGDAKLENALAAIDSLEAQLAELTAVVADGISQSVEKIAKADSEPEEDVLHPAIAEVEALTEQVEALHSQISRQAQTIQRLSKASLYSNTIPVEGSLVEPKTFEGWPADMAEDSPE